MTRRPRHFAKKLSRAQKGVVPNLMQALVEAEGRTAEECAERMTFEPPRCLGCNGDGRVWRYNLHDGRYAVPCPKCAGRGIAA